MNQTDPNARTKRALWVSFFVLCAAVGFVLVVVLIANIEPDEPQEPDLVIRSPSTNQEAVSIPSMRFTDVTAQAGLDFRHQNGAEGERLLPEAMGGGVAFFDFDRDDDQDLLFINSKSWSWSQDPIESRSELYRNDGGGNFERVEESGLEAELYGMGVAIGDYDGDGLSDVFVTAVGENRLYRNVQRTRFEDVTSTMGVGGDDTAWSTCATFFDYDGDGDLDLFVCNYVEWSRELDKEVDYRLAGIGRAYGPPTDFAGTNAYLYRNDRTHFTDVSAESGVHVLNSSTGFPVGKALGVVTVDLNDDGWLDLLVANDTVRNFAFLNQNGEKFVEAGIELGIAFDPGGKATGAMGIDFDYSNDEESVAIAIGNFANEMSSFYVRQGTSRAFTDDSIVSGVAAASRSALTFGLIFSDLDLDSRQDLLALNGHVEPDINRVQSSQLYEQAPQLWWNCGDACPQPFVLASNIEGNLSRPIVGRAAAYADIDNDGDLDLVFTTIGRAPVLLRNDTQSTNNWLRVSLHQYSANRFAVGATVTVQTGDLVQKRVVGRTRSYLSQVEMPLTFGLGTANKVDTVTVRWPDGSIDRLHDHDTNLYLTLFRSED